MRAILIALLTILLTGTVHAQKISPNVDYFSVETRIFADDAATEVILRYKNFSADWIRRDTRENFFKLKFDREIVSIMGSGVNWHVALNGCDNHGNFFVLPSVGINIYARIRPRLDIGLQFSGITLGGRGHVTDFEAGLKYFPRKNFSIGFGWRNIDFKLKRGGNSLKFVHSGPFIGLRCDF